MVVPVPLGGHSSGVAGATYAGVAVLIPDGGPTRDEVLAVLRELRFSGWLSAPDGGWLVAVAGATVDGGAGTVAAGRRGVVGVGEHLAERFAGAVLTFRVLSDRQLLLAVWADGAEVGRYVSDPSREPGADEDTLPDPLGADHAPGFATACGRAGAADELAEVLAEELDPESVSESERLAAVLRLLGLPRWLVAVGSLPRDVPTGPPAAAFTRLGAGRAGVAGTLRGRLADVVRRRRPPDPAITDAPQGGGEYDPWLM